MFKVRGFLLLIALCLMGHAQARPIYVAVASNFNIPAKKLAAQFSADTGHEVKLSFAASGKLYAQIKAGAPFSVFLSADQTKPEFLVQQGLAVANKRFTYAIGKLVLWSAKDDVSQPLMEQLTAGHFNKLALANPKIAPYGEAALQVLSRLGIREGKAKKWVLGENIAQTYQFVQSQNADLGLVAWSQLVAAGQHMSEHIWHIPAGYYSPIRQDLVLLSRAEQQVAALAFVDFMQSEKARDMILSHGYVLPDKE